MEGVNAGGIPDAARPTAILWFLRESSITIAPMSPDPAPSASAASVSPVSAVSAGSASAPSPDSLAGRRIALLVSGGIAVYKAVDVASRLRREGAEVRVAMTRAAREFVAPLSFEAVTGGPTYDEVLGRPDSHRMDHIEWARWAEALVVAPATADFLARMAAGLADDAPMTLYMAFDGPVWIAPAMNTVMWEHAATRANVETLLRRGARFVDPDSGPLACGEYGPGRLADPARIVETLARELPLAPPARRPPSAPGAKAGVADDRDASKAAGPLAGRTVLLTNGPTRERLDPIRFLSNRSTGRMGAEIAAEARRLGARVILVHGPMSVPVPEGVESVPVESAVEMLAACRERLASCDVAIFCAAVANYRAARMDPHKLKGGDTLSLELVRNPDIAGWCGENRRAGQLLVGFTAESQDLLETAERKLRDKKLDLILANPIGAPGVGFAGDDNEVTLIDRAGARIPSGRMRKDRVAAWIWARLLERAP